MRKWTKNGAKLLMMLSLLTAGMAFSACNFKIIDQSSQSVTESSSESTSEIEDSSSSETVYGVEVSINEWTMNVYEEIVLSAVATQDGVEIDSKIEWTSSDSAIATVVDGKVNALKAGMVTITASANGVSSFCVITIVNTAGEPQIVIDANEELQLRVGMTFQVSPTLVYNGSTYTDAMFNFISGNSEVFTVSEDGLITAVGEGDAYLTVSASWRGLSGNDLTEVLPVKVIEDVAITLSNPEPTTIYTTNKDFGNGETYINTVTYGATIFLNGSVLEGATATWSSSNPEVATIDEQTGVVTAVGIGQTAITLTYVSSSGRTYVSEEILLTVALPAIEKDVELLMGAQDIENSLLASEIFDEDEIQTIVSITDVTDGASNAIAYEDGKVTAELVEGEQKWMISNGEYGYIVDVLVATNVIRTAEDLAIFHFSTKTTTFRGTYVLANDIDASAYTHHQNVGWGSYNTGLTGTFDGRGHTIDGITLRQGGLFGVISSNSTVKNVAFTNVTLSDNGGTGDNLYTLASFTGANSKFENIFISIKEWPAGANKTTAALMSQYKTGSANETPALFKNVVVIAPTPTQTMANARAFFATHLGDAIFENVHILSSVQGFKNSDTMEGVTKYATVVDYDKNVNVSELAFDDMWDLTGAYPVFKTSAKVAPYTLTLDQTTANVYCEKNLTLTATAKDMLGNDVSSAMVWTSSNNEIATVENGVVHALALGTVTITVAIGDISLSCEVTVEEMPEEVNLAVNADNVATLYTTDKDIGDGKTYVKSATYTATATLNNEAITEGLVWASDNANVLTIDATTGVAMVVGVGTANVTVSYTGASGTTYVSESFVVTVEMPAIETGKELVFGSADENNPVIASEFTSDESFVVSGILDAENNTAIAYDAENNNVAATLTEGKYVWIINNGEYGYKVNAWVATNVIRDAEDLKIFNFNAETVVFGGTYVLANNIDASAYIHYTQFSKQNANGLQGTFDGRGYTIDGITMSQCGLFGNVNGTIKNVAFTNVKLSGNWSVLFGRSFWYKSVIENVYIQIAGWVNVDGLKLISSPLFIHNKANAARMENLVVVMPALPTTIAKAEAVGSLEGAKMTSTTTYTNVYVISPIATNVDSVTNYNGLYAFEENVNVSELTFGDIWDLTGAYPVFKTSEKVVPYTLTIDKTTTEMYVSETVTLTAIAKDFLGNEVDASKIEWTSSEMSIATVDGGVVSGLAEGETTITVSFAGLSVSCVITVNQKQENVIVAVAEDNVNKLYTANVQWGDVAYNKTTTFTANATLNDEAITEGLVWASDNTDVLTIDATTGVATAVGIGTANVTVSYTGESGTVYTSNAFVVTVEMPVIETGKEIVFGSADTNNPVVVSQFADDTNFVVSTIVDAANNTEIAYDAENNNVTAKLTEGKYEWLLGNGEYAYKVNVWVATNAIRTASDLAVFSVPDRYTVLAGTYVLANDIDASAYVHKFNIGWSAGANGLTGMFDGRGYTIDGITIRQGGLFGVISAGTVQNVAFTNVKLSAADDNGGTTGNHLYVLATLVWYGAKIDNVFVELDAWAATASKTTSVLFHSVKKATPSISNVVIITPAATGSETTVDPVVCSSANAAFTNVYVISPVTGTAIAGVTQYSDVATFKTNVTTSTLTGFNAYWDLTGDYPVFHTAK